ncbi:FadR/GntR family transcriptional regulator [Luteipulveratus halotolerans]|uniref:GntR family transcriptional regulator n=1 Tax=Luteipulveratus halotolerans TaxID=1631356 RepID=A0A0L6CGB6_9MICO|nr:FCD domain-containing protein [Luteipulveratus halotolerans]KNX36764.1 GntR family transcriptional regulator [Luteipulveratus halotolerans]
MTSAPGDRDQAARPPRAWEVVVAWVEKRILGGELKVGEQLPAERDLAEQLGVSRSAVREAVRTLQASGVVRSAVGAGATGGTTIAATPHEALTRMLRLHVALANFPGRDVTEVRVVLERLSVALTAEQASPGEVARVREVLEAMDDDGLDREQFNALDTEFHVAIARAAGNRLAADMTIAIRESMRLPILAGLRRVDDWHQHRAALREQHHGIMRAIEARQADAAADLVEQHIRTAFASIGVDPD